MSSILTGEAVALDLRVARLGSRSLAALLDVAVQGLLLAGGSLLLGAVLTEVDPTLRAAVTLVLIVAVLVGYPVGLETLWHGRTLGKAALGLRVVRDDGGPTTFWHALVRGLLGAFVERPGITFGFAAVLCSLSSSRGKRLGDVLAGTVVLQERVPSARLPYVAMPPPLAAWATSLDLSRLPNELAMAARQFVARAPSLRPAARESLGRDLVTAISAVVSPPPPPGTPGWAYLSAVLAERTRRETERMAQARAAAAGGVRAPAAQSAWIGSVPAAMSAPHPPPPALPPPAPESGFSVPG